MIVKRGKIFYARFQFGGRETWISTHCTSERDAKKAAARIEAEFDRERHTKQLSGAIIELAKQIARREITHRQAANPAADLERIATLNALSVIDAMLPAPALLASELWGRYMQSKPELKPSTLETKRQRFGKFIAWAGDRDMRDMDETRCEAFMRSLGAIRSHTRNNYIAELSSVWKAFPALDNPWGEHLRERLVVEHKRPFSIDQVRALLAYCRDNAELFWFSAVMVAYYTGLRLKDVVMLERSQITPDGYIDLIPAKTEASKKRVRIPINPELAAEMAALPLASLKYFFPEQVEIYNRSRGVLTVQFGRLLKRAGLSGTGLGFHSLRHTFVTEALKAGVAMKHVQAVVGHTSIEITEGTYYHGEKNADLTAYPSLNEFH